ncbi:hypothetical protein N7535_004258 [Penicillium sp. DV-2018c]|nr:hypothetical protein N7461_000036 [Penicillium sp. DV-2018c]KAJ5577332.1 hypothetical protein N7535_004258 [Penicillium sp. DV-2018c]
MDSTLRTPYNTEPFTKPSSSTSLNTSSSSTLHPSPSQSTMTAQAQSTLDIAASATKQVLSSTALQPTLSSPQTSAPPLQPSSQAIGGTTHPATLPTAPPSNANDLVSVNPVPAAASLRDNNTLGGPTATAPFLQDFNLVAEAAKRAQMGIVMRDLESVTL